MVKQAIQIYARIKPTKKATGVYSVDNEEIQNASLDFVVPRDLADGFVNNRRENYKFRFQKVFDQSAKQEDIFESIARPVADSVLSGYNGTIFAYGQTGSGKTFTITGGAERYADRGIIPRTLSYLYECFSLDSSMMYTTHISYLEIYNEMGYDLLDSRNEASRLEDLPKVMIREDPDHNIHLQNLSLHQSANEEEALNLLFLGDTNRMIAETPMNQASTRSHCIFTVHLCGREPGSATLRRSKLHLVDLAGSDRVGKTGLNGQLLTEAKYINLSLHFLEQVIIALSERNRSHIPYRNSMLTSVLRDSLGGNCMTTMIATLAVDKRNLDESISTCRFAQRVAVIKNEAVLNEELDPALVIMRLRQEIQSLKDELAMITGEQRDDQLTLEETQRLEEMVQAFLHDPDPNVTLSLGPDMRKIRFCFSLLKTLILDKGGRGNCQDGRLSPAARAVMQEDHPSAAEVVKLKEILTQRDNEISILGKMLKKEKKRAEESSAQLSSVNKAESQLEPKGSQQAPPAGPNGCAVHFMKRGPHLSQGKQEAFQTFVMDHRDHVTIEENKRLLKERSAEARKLGEQLGDARNNITELKKQLETRQRQRAAQGVVLNSRELDEDPVEENLRKHIEREKTGYKNIVSRLKALRTEIEHLQLLLERSKVKLQRDFHQWWKVEAGGEQDCQQESVSEEADARHGLSPPRTRSPSSPATPDAAFERHGGRESGSECSADSNPALRSAPPGAEGPVHLRSRSSKDAAAGGAADRTAAWRDLSSTALSSSSIPLTGDQRVDADIMAFVRARQKLLSRTGTSWR
ncbi:kinesin-like protein KIF6 isoform X2 [Synchiropus splendidus]|uniref:kinesin-like protein KIF6 isoform X2 n=1 Tax=Synchiropus splendidus TaxID=270530 RepID=UPI00237DE1C6|nr:kinesin-like protein KIF6 isoform X2 [Synchiropus splendidus]